MFSFARVDSLTATDTSIPLQIRTELIRARGESVPRHYKENTSESEEDISVDDLVLEDEVSYYTRNLNDVIRKKRKIDEIITDIVPYNAPETWLDTYKAKSKTLIRKYKNYAHVPKPSTDPARVPSDMLVYKLTFFHPIHNTKTQELLLLGYNKLSEIRI
jgi:hypothetical protein